MMRSLFQAKGFTAAAVLSLAIGIGGNVSMFSLVNSIVLQPLAYPEPERLVFVEEVIPKISHLYPTVFATAGHLEKWRTELKSVETVGGINEVTLNLTGDGEPQRLQGVAATWQFLETLGVKPQLGRWFRAEDGKDGGPGVAILSHRLWKSRYGGDPNVVGRRIVLNEKPYEVIGVMPARLALFGRELHSLLDTPERPDIYIPLRFSTQQLEQKDGDYNYATVARLKRGVTVQQAQAEMDVLMAGLSKGGGQKYEVFARMTGLQEALVGKTRTGLLVLMGAVGFVLLIVCVNLANLSLVRGTAQRKQLAIRAALGASRGQLVRHALGESLMLAAMGTGGGLLLAMWAVDMVVQQGMVQLPRMQEVSLSVPVVVFTFGLGALTVVLFGLLPAWRAGRIDPQEALQAGSRGNTDGPQGQRLRGMLVSVEVGLSTLLLIGAGLLLASFQKVMSNERGFDAENVVAVDLSLNGKTYEDGTRRIEFFQRVRDGVKTLPGIAQVGYVSALPLGAQSDISVVDIVGNQHLPLMERPLATYRRADSGYFAAIGIRLKAGRLFEEGEKEPVAVISETAARKLFGERNAIGQKVRRYGAEKWCTVVGVVADVRAAGLEKEPGLMVYQPYWQRGGGELTLVARTGMDATAVTGAIRERVWAVDKAIPVPDVQLMSRIVSGAAAQRRFQALLVGIFAVVALLLATIGIYGVVAYAVAQRRMEIGVRLALGANQRDVGGMVLREGMMPVVVGLVLGLGAAAMMAGVLRSMLYGVDALDPATFAGVAVVLAMVAALACWLPARRAARIDPMIALRYE